MWQVARAKYTDTEAIAAIEDSGGIDIEGTSPVMVSVHDPYQSTKSAKLGVVLSGGNNYPGIWLAQAAPDATNYAFLGAGNAILFNAPTGGSASFRIGNANKMKLWPSGGVAIGDSFYATDPGTDDVSIEKDLSIRATTATRPLDINSNIMRLRSAYTPATAGSAGYQGDICWDADYFYICVATNTWERTPHAWDINVYDDAAVTKLAGIEALADVTDATNVNVAGAVMTSDPSIEFDTIAEKTGDNGVDIETVNIKDGHINELQKLIFKDPTELTIAAGVVTVTQSRHIIDTQDNDAADNLDTINGGEEGQLLIINTVDSTRDVTLKHATGNILLSGGDYVMDSAYNMVMLTRHGSYWMKLM